MTDTPAKKPLTIDIVSDVMCPWCYVGKRRLEEALALVPDIAVDVCWRPYLLDPTLPPEGRDRKVYLESKFGGPEKAREIYARIEEAGETVGIAFDFDAIKISPNTIDAHRIIRWARTDDVQDAVVEALFKAYFLDGRNVGDHAVLIEVAGTAGMDPDLTAKLLAEGADREAVQRECEVARELGVSGVPCFILANHFAVQGAQAGELLANAIRQARDHVAAAA